MLRSILEDCQRAWPGVRLDESSFIQALSQRLGEKGAGREKGLEAMHTSDLYLACATAGGDPAATAEFEKLLVRATTAIIARTDSSPAFIEEVQQKLREKLLLPSGDKKPRIHDYTAQGSLKQWLRSAALRTALNMKQGGARFVTYEEESDPLLVASDPELDLIKQRYGGEFKAVLEAALARLSSRDRTVLRLYWVDGLNIDEIGRIYRVHRATVARWIAQCRKQLLEDAKRALKERLRVSHSELRSLVQLMRSQLHVSVSRVLKEDS